MRSGAPRVTAQAFRALFPDLESRTYLAACSLGARSGALDTALDRMLADMSGGAAAWSSFEAEVVRARTMFAALIGARPDQVALVPNASIGAYQVASGLPLAQRRRIVTSSVEFPSIAQVWLAQRPRGAEVVAADSAHPGDPLTGYASALDERTALVSLPLVGYADGAVWPVAEVAARAHAVGARAFVDAYQAVGVMPVDVTALGCDFLVAGAQKFLLGLPGAAFLFVREVSDQDREPTLTGWFGRIDPFAFDPFHLDFAPDARRFETGTPAVPALYAANAGLDLIAGLRMPEVRAHVVGLLTTAVEALTEDGEHFVLTGGPAGHGGHVGLVDPDPSALAAWLGGHGISVSPRGHLVRIAFHYYNDDHDVRRLREAVRRFRRR
ncbi:MAG TPA: aminotransferase class V-fold PLP-dependent enzyme [Micromonosporaceae bacterium]